MSGQVSVPRARVGWLRRWSAASALALVVVFVGGCAGAYTQPATDVTDTTATVRGFVFDPEDATVSYWFEYGPTKAYGSETPYRPLVINDRDNHPVSEDLSGLDPGTKYHYRTCVKHPIALCAADRTFTTTGGATELSITAAPSLYPGFAPNVSDYVTRCAGDPVTVDITAPADTTVAVDGGPARNGTFSRDVPLSAGKSFEIAVDGGGGTSTYHVRCLPGDFPAWSWTSPGDPSANFYITTPRNVQAPSGTPAGDYVAIFDDGGVPVWWMESSSPMDAKLLPDGTLAWGRPSANGFEVHQLDGTLVKTWKTVGVKIDLHDFQALPNGNVLIGSYPVRPGTTDLSAYGGPATNGTPIDAEIQEIKPDGSVAWSWNTKDHIDLSETPEHWRSIYSQPHALPDGRESYDWAHWNSLQKVGNTLVLSFRNLDAVYAIDMISGDVIWKLGGTERPESLTVNGDPESNPLSGQHYARILPNGDLTLHDNNTNETAAPRGAEYDLDPSAGTATLVDSISDPDVTTSPCCGSAAKLPDGSWLASWGGTEVISEFGANDNRHFKLQFTANPGSLGMSYRVDPVVGNSPTIADFRAGMDAMP
jgi:Arylsulfotransferase (ASST)